MATHVNLDALIRREDFEAVSDADDTQVKDSSPITDFTSDAFFYGALRKPDFQRETAEWDPARVVGLIRSFVDGELIPGVIVWKNKGLVFVIDGSHRLSALIAWVQDDYGDGIASQEFFNHDIPDDQRKIADRTRKLVEKEFGSYDSHRKAIADPAAYGPEIVSRARRFGSISLPLQWVNGDAVKAEASFVRINQRAAMITPQELELIESRRKPNAIAARAIIRKGTGHQYWSKFPAETQQSLKDMATELHGMMFEPALQYPIKSLDMPACGPVYSSTALRQVYDFINLCTSAPSPKDDTSGGAVTVDYLKLCRRAMWLLLSNHKSSIGLHPAVYFYSWTGKQQPILFLVVAEMLIEYDRTNQIPQFIASRKAFEDFLINNRSLVAQVVRKFGTKASGIGHLRTFYELTLSMIGGGLAGAGLVEAITSNAAYSYLQPAESPYDGTAPTRYSTQVKAGLVMRELLPTAIRCNICGGFVPSQAMSIDHKERKEDGGPSTVENAQVSHPYCNTGYKEAQRAKSKKGSA